MTKNDIVTRLRRDCMSLIADEAADEIESLRERLASVKAERMNAVSSLSEQVARLIRERDEARREVCLAREAAIRIAFHRDVAVTDESLHAAANARGWDCFKEKP